MNLATIQDVFPAAKPKLRSIYEKLISIRFEIARTGTPEAANKADALLIAWDDLEKRATAFIAEARREQQMELEDKLADLKAQLTTLEDKKLAALHEIGLLKNFVNTHATRLNAARNQMESLNNTGFGRQYPSPPEIAARQMQLNIAAAELNSAKEHYQEAQRQLTAAHLVHEEAARALAAKSEEARALDVQLIEFRQKT